MIATGEHWIASRNQLERTVEIPRGLVEIRRFDWSYKDSAVARRRPDMYIFELPLTGANARSPAERMAGRVALLPPSRQVPRNIAEGPHRSLLCLIEAGWIDSLLPQGMQWAGDNLRGDRLKFEWILRNIHKEVRGDGFGRATMIESFVNALAVELVRRLLASETNADALPRKGGLAPWRMKLLRERVSADCAMPSLAELADLCGMTVRHLCRAFKAETGLTPGDFVAAAMVQHAREMLTESTLPLGEIAQRLGFATSSSFSNAFQRATGLKPRQVERPARG
jgi:AraC-like DNA-binding protein